TNPPPRRTVTSRTGEHRRTRASFARALRRIASRIHAQPVQEVEWEDRILHERGRSRLRARALWVAGSFARGASNCGDLDLIADVVAEEGSLPWPTTISRA